VFPIGVGASKFLGVRRIFARIKLHKKSPPKKAPHVILGAISFKSKHVGHHFCSHCEFAQIFREFVKVFRDFARILKDFAWILRDFAQIFTKSKLLGVCLHPPASPPPTPALCPVVGLGPIVGRSGLFYWAVQRLLWAGFAAPVAWDQT